RARSPLDVGQPWQHGPCPLVRPGPRIRAPVVDRRLPSEPRPPAPGGERDPRNGGLRRGVRRRRWVEPPAGAIPRDGGRCSLLRSPTDRRLALVLAGGGGDLRSRVRAPPGSAG